MDIPTISISLNESNDADKNFQYVNNDNKITLSWEISAYIKNKEKNCIRKCASCIKRESSTNDPANKQILKNGNFYIYLLDLYFKFFKLLSTLSYWNCLSWRIVCHNGFIWCRHDNFFWRIVYINIYIYIYILLCNIFTGKTTLLNSLNFRNLNELKECLNFF